MNASLKIATKSETMPYTSNGVHVQSIENFEPTAEFSWRNCAARETFDSANIYVATVRDRFLIKMYRHLHSLYNV